MTKIKYFKAKSIHKFTLILLHGMNMNIISLYKTVNLLQKFNNNIKIILPVAPKININWPDGKESNISSWYNYYTRYDNKFKHDIINIDDFNNQTNRIYKILDKEIDLLGDSKKIIIGGFSQGGTIAFNVGLNYKYSLGGIIAIHSIFMDNIIKINKNLYSNKIPIFLFSGTEDKIYNLKFQNKSLSILRENNYRIFWQIEKNLSHCEFSKNEIKFLKNTLRNIFL